MAYERELEVALAAAREAGAAVLKFYQSDVGHWEKSKDNPLTLADLESDRIIGEHLRAAFPKDAILSEETVDDPSRLSNERVWIVDPMDGTKEFTKRIPEFGVSIALTRRGEPVVGVILNPAVGSTVWASEGNGTFRDGTRVRVSARDRAARRRRDREPHRDLARPVRALRGLVQAPRPGRIDRLEARLHRERRRRPQRLGRAEERVGRVRGRRAGA